MAAQGDYLKIKEVGKSNVMEFLAYCNYTLEKNEIEANRIKRSMKK